ncbi:hypothetical protein AB0L53_24340 [Nonomuraea sp. NPDC052129]|uniref:hypothetical protein n=1 Tax=Nonomuraea sp. NPDC052129 TaxID=3154651 RepID=UPI003432E6F3
MSAAVRQQAPVIVEGLTTGTREVSAQPDGTLKAVLSAKPVRALQAGHWVGAGRRLGRPPGGRGSWPSSEAVTRPHW